MPSNIYATGIGLGTCAAFVVLLWSATTIDAGTADWFAFVGPFMFAYVTLAVVCCFSCVPLARLYWSSSTKKDDEKSHLNKSWASMIVLWTLLVLLTIFFITLSLQADNVVTTGSTPSWGAPFGVLLATEILLFLYLMATLLPFWQSSGQSSMFLFCCGQDTQVPLCLGGGDIGTAKQRTAVQTATIAYQGTLIAALGLVIVGTGFLLSCLNGGGSITAAIVWFCIGLSAILIAGSVLLYVRMSRKPALINTQETYQDIWLVASGIAVILLLIFSILNVSSHTFAESAHIPFATLYVALLIVFIASCVIVSGDLATAPSGTTQRLYVDEQAPDNVDSPQGEQMRINWDDLREE